MTASKNLWEIRAQFSILQTYDIATAKTEVLKRFDHVIEAPNWTKDGKKLVYNGDGHIYFFDLETKESELIDTGIADSCNNDHVLSPDGSGVAVSSGRGEPGYASRIYTVNFGSGVAREITPISPSYLHGWSPDGKTFAYCAMREKENGIEADIYTCPVDGGEEVQLTFTHGLNDGPEYSPNGKHIWYNSVRSGLMQLWRMKADGSEQTQMTFDENANAWFAHVSPDGKTVVYIIYHKGDLEPGQHVPDKNVEIRSIPVEGGEEKTLISFFGGQGSINVNSWSPDSKKFAFVSYEKE